MSYELWDEPTRLEKTLAVGVVSLFVGAIALGALLWSTSAEGDDRSVGPTVKVERLFGGFGSGVHLGDGFVVTAAHVVKGETEFRIKFEDGSVCGPFKTESNIITFGDTPCRVEVMWVNETYDIALLHVEDTHGVDAADLSCEVPAVGTPIVVKGNPMMFEFVTSYGRVGSVPQPLAYMGKVVWPSAYTIDADVSPGNSGGPVFNEAGEVVGIVVGRIPGEALRWAVPGSVVCGLLGRVA